MKNNCKTASNNLQWAISLPKLQGRDALCYFTANYHCTISDSCPTVVRLKSDRSRKKTV